uniref:Uncharacterized protein n=1 Tax=Panagrolaimus sp. ES5 TaxID=591445 RepID=A0AC34FTD5_9BILA
MDAEDIAQTKSLIDEFERENLEDFCEDRKALECYKILSLRPGASKLAVSRRLRVLGLHFHPDSRNDEPCSYFKVISSCKNILSRRAPDEDDFETWNQIIIQKWIAAYEERNDEIDRLKDDLEQLSNRFEEAEKKNDEKDATIKALEKENKKLSCRAAKLETKVYEVEKILDKKGSGKNAEYLIHWRGFNDPKENTWVPVAKCNCPDLLAAFEADLKKKMTSLKKARKAIPSSRSRRASTVIVKLASGARKSLKSGGKCKRKIIGKLRK